MTCKGRLAEERTQVVGKDLNGMLIGALAFFTAHVAFDGRQQQTFRRILRGKRKLVCKRRENILFEFCLDRIQPVAFGDVHVHAQNALLFAACDRQGLVGLETIHTSLELIIRLVDAFFIHRIF